MKNIWIGACLALSLLGCGKSPLLNHATATPSTSKDKSSMPTTRNSGGTIDCPITFSATGFCAKLTWTTAPVVEERDGEALLQFWKTHDANGVVPADPSAQVFARLWMPAHGHGSTKSAVVSRISEGQYQLGRLHFIMSGDWDIQLELRDANGAVLDRSAVSISLN